MSVHITRSVLGKQRVLTNGLIMATVGPLLSATEKAGCVNAFGWRSLPPPLAEDPRLKSLLFGTAEPLPPARCLALGWSPAPPPPGPAAGEHPGRCRRPNCAASAGWPPPWRPVCIRLSSSFWQGGRRHRWYGGSRVFCFDPPARAEYFIMRVRKLSQFAAAVIITPIHVSTGPYF